jgi:hypothetical protein
MSSENQSKAANTFDFADTETKVTVYYVHQNRKIHGVTGVITSANSNKLVIESEKPNKTSILYVAKCQEYWDEEITVCSQDWCRLGAVLLITNNSRPVYFDYTDEI